MDLVETLKRISKIEVGETINSKGQIQNVNSWSTTFSRTYNGDDHNKTCNYLIELANQAIACIKSNQNNKEELILVLPEFILAISKYIETCSNKKYSGDVETVLTGCKTALEKVIIEYDVKKKS